MADSNATPAIRPRSGNRFPRLPKPFNDIGLLPFLRSQSSWFVVSYSGRADRLVEAGAIEPSVLEGGRFVGEAVDSHGFRMKRRGCLEKRIQVTRWIRSSAVAEALPGCAELIPNYYRWLREHPGELHCETVAETPHEITERFVGSAAALVEHGFCKEEADLYKGLTPAWKMLDGLYRIERKRPTELAKRADRVSGCIFNLRILRELLAPEFPAIFTSDITSALHKLDHRLRREERSLNTAKRRHGMQLVVDNQVHS